MVNDLLAIYVFDYPDLIPYLILYGLIIFLGLKSVKTKQHTPLLWMLIVVLLFSVIRFGIGYDYNAYYFIIRDELSMSSFERLEPLAQQLIEISRRTHFQVFFIVSSLIIYISVWYVCKKLSIDPRLSFMIYVLFPMFFGESLSVVRNHMAYSFALLSFYFFYKQKYIFTVLTFLVAIGFHYSILSVALVFLIYKYEYGRKVNLLLLLSSFVLGSIITSFLVSLSFDNVFFNKLLIQVERESQGGNVMTLLINGIAVMVLLLWENFRRNGKIERFYCRMVIMGAVIWNLFSIDYTLRLRFSTFYMLFLIFLMPYYGKSLGIKMANYKMMVTLFLVLLVSFSFYINIEDNLRTHAKVSLLPYQTVFDYTIY